MRKQISLLLDHGHPKAWTYPLGMALEEAEMVSERIRVQTATEAALLQVALSTQPNMNVELSFTKRAGREFEKLIKRMLGD